MRFGLFVENGLSLSQSVNQFDSSLCLAVKESLSKLGSVGNPRHSQKGKSVRLF